MDAPALIPPGEPIRPEEVSVPKARDLVYLLRSGHLAHVAFVEARRAPDGDVIVFDIEPEVPQHPVASIALVERIAVTFFDGDRRIPETVALREDFPREVSHLNLRPLNDSWPSLCLYEERYEDLKLRWTAAAYVRRVHDWLGRTARGALHEADQPLEPFIRAGARTIVLPPDLFATGQEYGDLAIYMAGREDDFVLVAHHRDRRNAETPAHRAVLIVTNPQVHGVIHHQPRTLEELHMLLEPLDIDVLGALRQRVRDWRDDEDAQEAHLAIVAVIPRTRAEGAEPEAHDVWVFLTGLSIRELGAAVGVWTLEAGGVRAALLEPDLAQRGGDVPLELLRPVSGLSRQNAAELSGVAPATPRIAAVGAGALGSQVMENAVRTGWGDWSIVDEDHLLPHNLVRHGLPGAAVGVRKAIGAAIVANGLFHTEEVARGIVADVLDSEGHEELRKAFRDAELIMDMSASPAVGRHLATDAGSPARRTALFLNPAGTDLVLLAEDTERRVRLDDLEMQHYREVIRSNTLADHLRPAGRRLRYGQSCRDLTLPIPQDRVAVAAGIGARAIRLASEAPEARIRLWRLRPDLGVDALSPDVHAVHSLDRYGWQVRYDDGVIERFAALRTERLPNETGGVLIGHRDMQRRILYVVEALPAPPDSKERPVYFERGSAGLRAEVEEITSKTAGALVYVGEWHSHPEGQGLEPSPDDRNLFGWLACHLAPEGLPPLMVIVGDRGVEVYVEMLP